MNALEEAARAFAAAKTEAIREAVQVAALRLSCGVDREHIMASPEPERRSAAHRVRRIMRRERLKALSGQRAYDLDRQLALRDAAAAILRDD